MTIQVVDPVELARRITGKMMDKAKSSDSPMVADACMKCADIVVAELRAMIKEAEAKIGGI